MRRGLRSRSGLALGMWIWIGAFEMMGWERRERVFEAYFGGLMGVEWMIGCEGLVEGGIRGGFGDLRRRG